MAKIKMLCPFSKELCRECAQYRGRHYYLCFYTKYRGYLGGQEESGQKTRRGQKRSFEMPSSLPISPKWLVFNEFIERKER
ncbi:MAG: hypothetical protein ACETWK_00580 [Candidatus Aminicenantaceae bacterium]